MTTENPQGLAVEAQIQQLRQQAQALGVQRATAERQKAAAGEAAERVAADLSAEFGVGSIPEAEELQAALDQQIAAQAAAVSQYLAQAGAPQ
jgi:adenylyl- and sulfurtransferase ThiI